MNRPRHTLRSKENRPLLSIALITLLVVVVVAAYGAASLFDQEEPALIGTELDARPAPEFQLTDHRGQPVQLSDFRGRAVALTFIFTNCTDVCLLTAMNIEAAYDMLPEDRRDDVAFLAVTVDPERDTQTALQEFSDNFGLADNPSWFALWGESSTLESVWQNYGVNPGTAMATPGQHDGDHGAGVGGGTGHTDGVYIIDPEGRERVFMRSSDDPEALADNLLALL